jgi:aspartate aminotransferase-like enzyme
MSGKRYLMTPGPTPVPPAVLAALAQPIVHHRSPDFRPLFARCLERLQRIYRTRGDALLLTASGTGAMESVVANLTAPGDRVLVVSAGNFGERWGAIADAHGCEVEWLRLPWGDTPTPDALGAKLGETGRVKVVFLTHSETSTGVVCDLQALAATVREAGPLVAVDAVSSLGAVPLETDAWGLDAVASGSQKALMSPPGLAMVAVSERAFAERVPARSYYFDWERIRSAQARLDSAFTPAVSLVAALDVALGLILEEIGLDAVWTRHARLGRACRAGLTAMGLELFSPDDDRAAVVTAVHAPEGVDATEVVRALRDRFGITIANGQGELKGRIFRIGHIGYFDVFDITTTLSAVELALAELGADVERGAAAAAALEAFEHARV